MDLFGWLNGYFFRISFLTKRLTNPGGCHKIIKHVSEERPCLFPEHRTRIIKHIK